MPKLPEHIVLAIKNREKTNSLRVLPIAVNDIVDFTSNDYLGFALNNDIKIEAQKILQEHNINCNGATGSRLLTGNYKLYDYAERIIAETHKIESALLFNSGYDANVGLLSAIPQRHHVILYDELSHASIRDGIALSKAKAYKFKHNNIEHLQQLINKFNNAEAIYVVTESVFSMDGDSPDLNKIISVCEKNNCYLIVDEAHAVGIYNTGLIDALRVQDKIFARVITFGKALGSHGAAVLGSKPLKTYLVNFARSLIYTTALPPHSIATTLAAYKQLAQTREIDRLQDNINFFKTQISTYNLAQRFILSDTAIQCCIVPGNNNVKQVSNKLLEQGFLVKPILSPTVPEGKERLRFCIHSFNSKTQITEVLQLLTTFVV